MTDGMLKDSRNLQEMLASFKQQMTYSPENFGVNVKSARKKLRLTQDEAARRSQVAPRTFIQWEHGKSMPRGYNLENLAKALQVDPVDLLNGVTDTEPPPDLFERLDQLEAKLDRVLLILGTTDAAIEALSRRDDDPESGSPSHPRLPTVRPPAKGAKTQRSA